MKLEYGKVGPVGPVAPGGPPAGPVGPGIPAAPAGPVGPGAPAAPVGPVGPGTPAAPVGPVGPGGPVGPSAPAGPAGPGTGHSRWQDPQQVIPNPLLLWQYIEPETSSFILSIFYEMQNICVPFCICHQKVDPVST